MSRFLAAFALSALLVFTGAMGPAEATARKGGLSITPLRQFVNVDAGTPKNSSITLGNQSGATLNIILSIKQFSVNDYSYDYDFENPGNNWLVLGQTTLQLQPGKSQKIPYTLNVPKGVAPGGQYYTILASANLSNQGVHSTIQAATLIYMTVNGLLVQTNKLISNSLQHIAFGKQISYSLVSENTGNIHYFMYLSGHVHGWLSGPTASERTYLLMPHAPRRISGTIPSPVLPGIYKATYGYHTDAGSSVSRSGIVVFIPPWFIALSIFILFASIKLKPKKKPTPVAASKTSVE
jgi:hypothetical protein